MNITGRYPQSVVKRHLDVTLGKMLQPERGARADTLAPYLRAANIEWGNIRFPDMKEMWFSPADKLKYALREGDMVVLEGGDVGRAAIVNELNDFVGFQNSVHRVRPRERDDVRFAFYWMHHLKNVGYFDLVCSKATLAHFTAEKFAVTPYPMLDLPTQKRIAAFLDRETERIDALIGRKQRLVVVMQSRRMGSIMAAVAGTDLPSQLLRRLYRVQTGKTPSRSDEGNFGGPEDMLWATPVDLNDDIPVLSTSERISSLGLEGMRPVPTGTVLVNGIGAGVGKVGVAGREMVFNQQIHALLPRSARMLDSYLLYCLIARRAEMLSLANLNTIPIMNGERLGRVMLPIPAIQEQHQVVATLGSEGRRLRLTGTMVLQSIDRLREYRAALITAAVTGQIDVDSYARKGGADRDLERIEEEMQA